MAAPALSETVLAEPLFLDITIQQATTNTAWMPVVEPWASEYANALRDGRFGDAVWARYHIAGDVQDGHIDTGSRHVTVLEIIEEDALGYWSADPDGYASALEFYVQTADKNEHKQVIDLLVRCGKGDVTTKVKI